MQIVGEELANKFNLLFIESSAKNFHNIDNIFNMLSIQILNSITNFNYEDLNNDSIRLGEINNTKLSNEYKKCCN